MQTLKEFLTHNWFAKLFSIVLATMLWITISSEANSEIGIVIPLEYRNIPPQLEVIGDTTNTVEVRLRGPAALIKEILPRDISATVDLAGLPPGEKIVQLTPQHVRSPFGVEVVRVGPSQVRLNLERTTSKTLPVIVTLDGEAAPGFAVHESASVPASVEVQGPASRVQVIESVPTSPVRIGGKSASFSETVDLDLPDPMVRLQYLSPVEVHVTILPIQQRGPN
jgi:YbbR domain-containing protein